MDRRVLLVFACSALWLALGLFRPLEVYDEGIPLVAGQRILDGDLPYRDFYAIYAPGQYYLTACAQWLLGRSVLAERLGSLLIRASIATLGFVLARRVASASWAWCGWALVLAWLSFFSFFSNSSFSGLLFSLAGIAAATAPHVSAPRRLLFAGAWCGVAFLFRQDYGVYACAGQLGVLAFRALAESASRRLGAVALARGAALFGAGFLALVALPAAYFAGELGPGRLFHALFVWPLELTNKYRALPWPGLDTADVHLLAERLPFYTAPLTLLLVGLVLARPLLRGPRDGVSWTRLQLLLFGVLVLNQALRRSDLMHLAPAHICALILLPALLELIGRARLRALPRVAAAVLVALVLGWAPARVFARSSLPALAQAKEHGIERARYIPLAEDQILALRYVRERTGPEDPIYVGNWRHDVVIWNDIAFYFLADRPIPTRYHKFDPGHTTTESVQREIANDLERAGVRWVVLYGLSGLFVEPNGSAVPDSRLLDEYIAAHYQPAATFGNYRILQRALP